MRSTFLKKTFLLFLSASIIFHLSSFTNDTKNFCTATVHIKNNSSTHSISRIWVNYPTGGTGWINVNIPPGGTYTPVAGPFVGSSILSVRFGTYSPPVGGIVMCTGGYDGTVVACNTSIGNNILSVNWSAGCLHYYATVYDNGDPCIQ